MNSDDLLSFKEYSPTKDNYSNSGRAEININSPNRTINPYSDQHLEGLIDDMTTSVRVLDREDEMQPNGIPLLFMIHRCSVDLTFDNTFSQMETKPQTTSRSTLSSASSIINSFSTLTHPW